MKYFEKKEGRMGLKAIKKRQQQIQNRLSTSNCYSERKWNINMSTTTAHVIYNPCWL